LSIGIRIIVSYDTYAWNPADFPIGVAVAEDWIHDTNMPCEHVGLGHIATGSVKKVADLWRTFTKSSWVLTWVEKRF